MTHIIKHFNGFSGSKVLLIEKNGIPLIRKINNIERNYTQLKKLYDLGFNVPQIYHKESDVLEMEYIDGLDMKTYILNYGIDGLFNFIQNTIDTFRLNEFKKNYTNIYNQKLNWLNNQNILPFSSEDLIKRLPTTIVNSLAYHGDMTLQNIIYSQKKNKFYMIDCSDTEYDSWIFDLAKMQQDLKCYWFIRNDKDTNVITYLNILRNKIIKKYPILENNNLIILMLLRVLPYTKKNDTNYVFLLDEIKKLWK